MFLKIEKNQNNWKILDIGCGYTAQLKMHKHL